MAGGHGGRAAVAQVTNQESDLSPYPKSVFQARSYRQALLPAGSRCVQVTEPRSSNHFNAARELIKLAHASGGNRKVMWLRRASLLVLLVAACTNPGMQQNAGTQHAPNVAKGTILSVHTVPAATQLAVWHLLSGDAAPAATAQRAEFIVREDDGATIAIVQDNALGLRAGDRVDIVHGERAHLTRA
jgi:hypothetical protein